MSEIKTETKTETKSSIFPWLISILLLLAIVFCFWQLKHQYDAKKKSCSIEQIALENRKKELSEQLAYLQNLLKLSPCEAQLKISK